MKAREGVMSSREYGEELHKLYPVVENEMTDSGWSKMKSKMILNPIFRLF